MRLPRCCSQSLHAEWLLDKYLIPLRSEPPFPRWIHPHPVVWAREVPPHLGASEAALCEAHTNPLSSLAKRQVRLSHVLLSSGGKTSGILCMQLRPGSPAASRASFAPLPRVSRNRNVATKNRWRYTCIFFPKNPNIANWLKKEIS